MYRVIYVILVLLVLHVMLPLAADASSAAMDIRDAVPVTLVNSRDAGVATIAVKRLSEALVADQFPVEIVASLPGQPVKYFREHPEINHLIVGFLPYDKQGVEVYIYTQAMPSPKAIQAKSVNELVLKVTEYLKCEKMVLHRSKISKITDAFSSHMSSGLRYLLDEKDMHEATRQFVKASRLIPNDPRPHFNLALAYKQIGNHDKRKEHVEIGLKLDPESNDLRNEKAVILLMEGRFMQAIEVLKELPRDNPRIQWNLAFAYLKLGEREKAIAELRQIIKLEADTHVTSIAEYRLNKLEKDSKRLSIALKALWVSLIGLAAIGVITLWIRFLTKEPSCKKGINRKTVSALNVARVVVGLISSVFSLFTILLDKLVG